MAATLKSSAVQSANRGQPSSFYGNDKSNPVFQSLEQELKRFRGYIKKKNVVGYRKPDDEPCSRPADTLFELWNKFEPKIPVRYYQEKLLELGDYLMTLNEYSLALFQCYDRYLLHFGQINVEEITDTDKFKATFFPEGFESENAGLTFRALMGKSISMYQVVRTFDEKLQNKQSIDKCVQILCFLRLVMQVVLPRETLCWLVYNGTIHIYSISRHLMSLGHSSRVIEFLLWASMCMETSVPLLAVKYLPWRSTLYTAVCQCYFDCKATHHAEAFARRGLAKINELSQLENLSNSVETITSEISFRQATVKMAVMVFKRTVYETRRKPKGLLRPKTRANLKDAQNLPWPRTPTEKLLTDMFEGSASQFLAILESLTDTNRRILLTAPPAPDADVEILDVCAELFMAGQEILAGGGGHRGAAPKPQSEVGLPALAGVVSGKSLMDMGTKGEDGATLSGAIKLVKMAYCFEQWDVFDVLVESVLTYIRILNEDQYAWDEKALELLVAMEKVNPNRRHKRNMTSVGDEDTVTKDTKDDDRGSQQAHSAKSVNLNDELIQVAEVLITIITGPFSPSSIEVDIIVDAALFMWNKTKTVFQKHQTGSFDNPKYLQRMDNPNKWVYILDVVHQVLCWCGISSVDPALTAEVVLRLALVLESSAYLDEENLMAQKESKTSVSDGGYDSQQLISRTSMLSSSMLNVNPRNQLLQARDILELGLENVSYARQAVALNDGNSIADVGWAKLDGPKEPNPQPVMADDPELRSMSQVSSLDLNDDVFSQIEGQEEGTKPTEPPPLPEEPQDKSEPQKDSGQGSATAVWNTIKDLHLELMLMYHRVCLKLSNMGPDPAASMPKPFKRRTCSKMEYGSSGTISDSYIEDFKELTSRCNRNQLSKALLYMQKSLLLSEGGMPTKEQRKLLQDAVALIQKTQTEEKRIYTDNTCLDQSSVRPTEVPPPPVLLCRTDTMMVFKPAPFIPADGQKVAWYRLFARSATGSNIKVRLNDYYYPGTGEEVPVYNNEMRVYGLQRDEKYMFAVAAYNAAGKLIGGSVGESTKPILASHPLPVLMTWAFLSQFAYQVGCYDIARQACDVLWDHFIIKPPPPQSVTYVTKSEGEFRISLMQLDQTLVALTSPVLLRQFLTSIFIGVDMGVREADLFCDVVSDKGPLFRGQMKRLAECEKMIVAMELAGWLNEANLALQAVVQCYGLLAPLIFYKIPSPAVVQVLQRCLAVLQEVPSGLRQKRPQNIADSIHHMTACVTYHMAKVLRSWGQKSLANTINETGRRLLALDEGDDSKDSKGKKDQQEKEKEEIPQDLNGEDSDGGPGPLQVLKSKRRGKKPAAAKEEPEGPVNEELKALEAHMLSISKQAQYDHELSGYEDPNILHAYIAYLPSKLAYREVAKFKKRQRYLEFFVQVAQKALTEGLAAQASDWCDETAGWLSKRNEQIIGTKPFLGKQPAHGVVTVTGDDPKRFAAAVVEYNKEKDTTTPRVAGANASKTNQPKSTAKPKRRRQYKPLLVNANMTEYARQMQEEAEVKSIEKFSELFPDMYHAFLRKRKLRKLCTDEMPWRTQLNLIQGMSHFSSFLQKMETRDKVLGTTSSNMYRTNFLDQEWFTFETAGTLVVGWEGGPVKQTAPGQHTTDTDAQRRERNRQSDGLDLAMDSDRPRTNATGIEIAAALATGSQPPPMFFIPPEVEDTPRTYRSDVSNAYNAKNPPQKKGQDVESILLSTKDTVEALRKTFTFFNRAINLSHRGQHWTLLQNACRALWNCAHTALLRAFSSTAGEDGLLTNDELRALMWKPFYNAADCVLDMLTYFQADLENLAAKAQKKQKKLGDYFESWMGDIQNEKGGASLKFENPLDDMSLTDMRWVRRLVIRVLEMLYYEKKWEKLADIALRFSALSNDRYAEQIVPVLVQAQRQLTARVQELGGEEPPQPHFRIMMAKLDGIITAKRYLQNQLVLCPVMRRDNEISPGGRIDPMGHNLYRPTDAQMMVSVPLDVPYSLQTLREVFDKSQYTCRALQHSRKLMILYLAGQQNSGDGGLSRQVSRVEFLPTTARPEPTMPTDISREEYLNMDDVQASALPRSQLGTVISSYEKTIEMLLAKNQRGLAAQAMHELGNLQYHNGSIRGAYKWWAEALDFVLNTTDTLHTWRGLFKDSKDISSDILQRCGLWGCVLGGVLASNIAQYILTSDLGLRMESCFLSGNFFKALFRSSLPHPTADRDYALYEVGEGCEVTNLVPGIDLLSDKYRGDGRQLIAALRWVSEELSRGRHNLFVLPLLTLYQYFTTFVCRDLQRSVDGRILKVRILTDLGLYTEAFITLQRLLHGERLPHTGDSNFRQVESKISSLKFDTGKPIMEPANLRLLENVLDKRLSSSLATLFGPHLTCHMSLVQAHLFTSLAESIPVIPSMEEIILPEGRGELKPFTISTMSKGGVGANNKSRTPSNSKQNENEQDDKNNGDTDETDNKEEVTPQETEIQTEDSVPKKDVESDQSGHFTKRFTHSKKPITLEFIKGTLLAISEQMVSTISEVIQENAEYDKGLQGLPAAELELVVLCKLEQACIARQKQHAPMAARIVLSALKLLKSSDLFKRKKDVPAQPRPSSLKGYGGGSKRFSNIQSDIKIVQPENSQFQFQNFQSRSRLDARLWLDCRIALVKSLMMEIRGMGEVKDPETKVLQDLADCRQYCIEGLGEAEACGDVEMQAEFFLCGAYLNIIEGKSIEHTVGLIQDAIRLLQTIARLSVPGEQMLAMAIVLQTDLEAVERVDETVLFTERTLDQYVMAQTRILQQMEELGESIEHYYPVGRKPHFSSPTSPLRNIYLPQVLKLAQIKFRIGHAMSRNAAKYIRGGDIMKNGKMANDDMRTDRSPASLWTESLGVLMTALELSQVSVMREANLEAEILLNLGKVQRMLVYMGKMNARKAADTLLEAVRISHTTDHDLGLMRQAYLEVAMVYLYSSGLIALKDNSSLEIINDTLDDQDVASIKSGSSKKTAKSWKSKKDRASSRSKSTKSEDLADQEKERRAAWLAIRCAASIAQAQRCRELLIGDPSVTSQVLNDKAKDQIPDFVALDLVSAYVLGEKKKVYKNEIEEELSTMVEAQEVKHVETYEEQVNKAKDSAKELGWIHFLGYQTILQRLCSTATVSASSATQDNGMDKGDNEGELGPEFDLGFISHLQCDTTMNHDVVRSMVFSGCWARRVNKIHNYLAANLINYSSDCCAIYPPGPLLLPIPSSPPEELNIIYTSYTPNLTVPSDTDEALQPAIKVEPGKPPPPPGTNTESHKPSDKAVTSPVDVEVAIQFYQPSLEENDPQRPEATGSEARILLLYALYKKSTGTLYPGLQWLSMAELNDLHDRLAVLEQRAEISLIEKKKKDPSPVTPSPTPTTKSKKAARIKALSPKVERDEGLENLLRQCVEDTAKLLGVQIEPKPQTEQTEGQGPTSTEIPFEVSRQNVRMFENIFDPSLGSTTGGTDITKWLLSLFQ